MIVLLDIGGKDTVFILHDRKPSLKRYKTEKYRGAVDLDLEIVPGDGHCISHCFARHFVEPLNVILKRLKSEFHKNIDIIYKEFSVSPKEVVLHEVDEYVSTTDTTMNQVICSYILIQELLAF